MNDGFIVVYPSHTGQVSVIGVDLTILSILDLNQFQLNLETT